MIISLIQPYDDKVTSFFSLEYKSIQWGELLPNCMCLPWDDSALNSGQSTNIVHCMVLGFKESGPYASRCPMIYIDNRPLRGLF